MMIDQETTSVADIAEEPLTGSESMGAQFVKMIGIITSLVRHKIRIAILTGSGLLVGTAISLVLPVKFTAMTKIMTPQQSSSSAPLLMSQMANPQASALAASAIGSGALGLKNPNDLYIGLLNSRPIADAIIERFSLVSVYRVKDMTGARKKLKANTTISSEKSGLLVISVTDRDKNRAAEIANDYTNELHKLSKTLALSESSQRREFFEEHLKSAKTDLVAAEASFGDVQRKRGLIHPDAQAKALIEGLAELRAQAVGKQVQLQALRSFSTDNNPDVQLAERELLSLKAEVSRSEEKNHPRGFSQLGMGDVPDAGLEYLTAEHELQYRQIIFDLLMKQFDAARLDESKGAAVIQVVEGAIPPERKSAPNRLSVILISISLGFLSACTWFLIADFFDNDLGASLALSELKSTLGGR